MYRTAPGTGSVTTAASSSSGSAAEPTGSPRTNLRHGRALSPDPPAPSHCPLPSKRWDRPYWSPLAAGGKLRLTTSTNSATVSASVKMTALGPASKV